ncbi:hypothetical protein AB0B50_10530 [Streptomyces sp. NPDC041068]|uniref:hypothetical protein n=1 Tax=Streptomyces sp. NPDC041068 TaxID=3155130 RepID=UPI0033EDD967
MPGARATGTAGGIGSGRAKVKAKKAKGKRAKGKKGKKAKAKKVTAKFKAFQGG